MLLRGHLSVGRRSAAAFTVFPTLRKQHSRAAAASSQDDGMRLKGGGRILGGIHMSSTIANFLFKHSLHFLVTSHVSLISTCCESLFYDQQYTGIK